MRPRNRRAVCFLTLIALPHYIRIELPTAALALSSILQAAPMTPLAVGIHRLTNSSARQFIIMVVIYAIPLPPSPFLSRAPRLFFFSFSPACTWSC